MICSKNRGCLLLVALLLSGLSLTGCGLDLEEILDELEELELTIDQSVDIIQQIDPRNLVPPQDFVDRGDTVIIDNSVDVIVDVSDDLVYEELPNITLLGFENLTGFDVYITYYADNELQGVFVYDGETLLLEYDCLTWVDLDWEEDFDPVTGAFWAEYDLDGISFGPTDFYCGEALIITIDAFGVYATVEYIDLVP